MFEGAAKRDWALAFLVALMAFAAVANLTLDILSPRTIITLNSGEHSGPERASDPERNQKRPEVSGESSDQRLADYTFWLTICTGVLAASTIGLWVVTGLGLRHAREDSARQARDMGKSLRIALSAVDKPWLYIDSPMHNGQEWLQGEIRLSIVLPFANFGKAPAFLQYFTAAVFLSPGPRGKLSDMPKGVDWGMLGFIDIPEADEVRSFVNRKGKSLLDRESSVVFSDIETGMERRRTLKTAPFILPLIVAADAKSDHFMLDGAGPIKQRSGIAIEASMGLFVMGRYSYIGPEGHSHVVHFCLKGIRGGRFTEVFGAPYNERTTNDDPA